MQAGRINQVHLHYSRPAGGEAPQRSSDAGPVDWESQVLVDPQDLIHVEEIVGGLASAIESPTTPAITVSGAGGVGKTAVTHAAVKRVVAGGRFTHVVWASAKNVRFSSGDVGQAAVDSIYWHDLLRMVCEQLGCPLPPSQSLWEGELRRWFADELRGARVLVVVDNLEFVHSAQRVIARLRDLGVRQPHKVVATTRWRVTEEFDVRDFGIRPLARAGTYDLVRLLAAGSTSDLQSAGDDDLAPIFDITEGNPFLVKLITRRFVVTGRSLDRILAEVGAAGEHELGGRVRTWLFDRSLDQLRESTSEQEAVNLLFSFCIGGRGGSLRYDDLRSETAAADDDRFDHILEVGCRLGIIRPSDHNRRYSIHSLLYQYTCPLAWSSATAG
ncbi:ATP-binding protein [Actinokineospora bangkokensis]|uniref:Uncharacterized protein n=1 Tax=Actinokineospora bangkokensis TaxID=1193682 RepID=A0A1Q9LLL2_9PSEU|nr:ATP-binding protein [Actinokineospora bangkokensis]OLR92905.1 hypothetical protein BJP25_18180 [Actinokineospora bangkokensis]